MGAWKFLRSVIAGIPIGLCIVSSVGSIVKVNGVSMQPVLNPNNNSDWVVLNRWAVRDFNVQRGEIVCLISPRNPDSRLIKRVIALEGDIVKTLNSSEDFIQIPEGHCWVEGENHQFSMDSNFFGPVPLGLITAKASHIIWPLNRIGELSSFLPPGREVFYK